MYFERRDIRAALLLPGQIVLTTEPPRNPGWLRHFPDEQAATKLIYLAITRAEARWTKNRAWTSARAGLKIHFGDRFPG